MNEITEFTDCSKQVRIWAMGVRAFIYLVQSMLLPVQGEQGFLSPAFLPHSSPVHPAIDDECSPLPLTLLPHSKLVSQLPEASTDKSCPVWLQTKHKRDLGTTSDDRKGLHVVLTSFTRHEEDVPRHYIFWAKVLTFSHYALPIKIFHVHTFVWASMYVCVCVC